VKKEQLAKLKEMYGGGDPEWFEWDQYKKAPLLKRVVLGFKRIGKTRVY
jgi:hypothetical protein